MTNERDQRLRRKIEQDRKHADQGQFFFAKLINSYGDEIPHPVFVVGKNGDSNDDCDVLICQCTKADHPLRSDYDIPVQLKLKTYVRTNKIFTTGRDQLVFKIPTSHVSEDTIRKLISSAMQAITHKEAT